LRTSELALTVAIRARSLSKTWVKLPRFAGLVVKPYAAFFFSKQSSNPSGVS